VLTGSESLVCVANIPDVGVEETMNGFTNVVMSDSALRSRTTASPRPPSTPPAERTIPAPSAPTPSRPTRFRGLLGGGHPTAK